MNEKQLDKTVLYFKATIKEFFDFEFTDWQLEISREIFSRVFMRKRHTIILSICRQVGKTESVVYAVWFLCNIFNSIQKEPFRVCFTAPERGTGSEIFNRLRILFDKCKEWYPQYFQFKEKTNDSITLYNGTKVEVYGLFKGFAKREDKKTTREGRTFHLVVRDEMHIGEDLIYQDEIEPAMSTTGGVDIMIGNGGYRNCLARKKIDNGSNDKNTIFMYDFDKMRIEAQKAYDKTGNELFMRWLDSQEQYIEDNGFESDVVQKNLYCKWLVEFGNFISEDVLYSCRRDYDIKPDRVDVGIDFGKSSDKTVVTLTDYDNNIIEWFTFRGPYTTQVQEIKEALSGYDIGRIYYDSTGSGDVVGEILRQELRLPTYGIVFNVKTKHNMGTKGLLAFTSNKKLTYPDNNKHTRLFEKEMRELLKEYRQESGLLNFKHPDRPDAHDDFPDSYFLSIWNIMRVRNANIFAKDSMN